MPSIHKITPCLWFDDQAEQAAQFYTSIFPNSRIMTVTRFGEAGHEIHGRPAGSVMVVAFELHGHGFTALNGGPVFRFNEAISLQVHCADQQELDRYWQKLGDGGDPNAQQCGWLKDKFGLSWQIVPNNIDELVGDPTNPKSQAAMNAILGMKKIDIAAVERAYAQAR
jgi:predicted 3-demethylubiquinone-9 3-methyltransferase (glyoxalase superfamily)